MFQSPMTNKETDSRIHNIRKGLSFSSQIHAPLWSPIVRNTLSKISNNMPHHGYLTELFYIHHYREQSIALQL